MGRRSVVLNAVAFEAGHKLAPFVLDRLRLKDRLIGIRLLLAGQRLLKRKGVESRLQFDFGGGPRNCRRHAVGDLLQRQCAPYRPWVITAQQYSNRKSRTLLGSSRRFDALDENLILVAIAGSQRDDVDL